MTVDLNTCLPGQKVRLRNGAIVKYDYSYQNNSFKPYTHRVDGCSYMDDGSYFKGRHKSEMDIVEILPLETIEPPKSDKHPSVAWWESCPWITDRTPTEADGNAVGWVMAKLKDSSDVATVFGPSIALGQPWIHRQDWQPPVLSNKEKALELLNKHKDGVTMCVWIPTSEDWTTIRKGLEE
jgi:hypothetical protein